MKKGLFLLIYSLFLIVVTCFAGMFGGILVTRFTGLSTNSGVNQQDLKVVNEQNAVIDVVSKSSDSVVSIVVSKDLSTFENLQTDPLVQNNSQGTPTPNLQEIGAGSGFIVSQDGLIITNRHVVDDTSASYTVVFNDKKTYDAKILARDTLLDIAFIKIEATGLKPLTLGVSSKLKVGQSVVAIGDALGEFSNTVSSGIISGLKRSITAGDQLGGSTERLSDVIQTDASINLGNSGGPLLDLEGNVIGVNVAIAQDAQNIGFAIPSDVVRDLLDRLNKDGNIDRPILGVRYQLINLDNQTLLKASTDYGALIIKGSKSEPAIVSGSPAEKAGLKENDIILEVDGVKVNSDNPLSNLIQVHKMGDVVTLKISRNGKEINVPITLNKF